MISTVKRTFLLLALVAPISAWINSKVYLSNSRPELSIHAVKKHDFSMNIFGVKKLGQSILDQVITRAPPVEDQSTSTLPKIGTVDSNSEGDFDSQREFLPYETETKEFEIKTVENIATLIKKKQLLETLRNPRTPQFFKMEAINRAVGEGLLPDTSDFDRKAIRSTRLSAGGLYQDW